MPDHSRAPASATRCSGYLLCRRYVTVHFHQVSIAWKEDAERGPVQHWAFGVLSDGQSEALGTWPQDRSGAMSWRRACDDLKDRGVERIRFALSGELTNFREDLRARFPGATALPSFAHLLDRSVSQVAARHRAPVSERLRAVIETESGLEARASLAAFESSRWGVRYPALVADWRIALEQGWALWSLAPTLRREVLSGDGRAAALNRSLRKAVDRHGGFADAGEASAFIHAVLAREQRRLESAPVAGATEHQHHREGFGSRMSALGV
jgi:putative transposase